MTDDKPTSPPTHREPASAHEPQTHGHVRDMEGLGGHVDEHTSSDHGHAEPRVGPIDWAAWGYGLLGVAAGLLVVVAFWLAIT